MKQAIILAGGRGTRLEARLFGKPKPLIDVCGSPLLQHQLQLLNEFQFRSVLLLVNHGSDQIRAFCTSRDWGMDIQCIDDGEPRGTAGAALAVLDRLQEEFLVVYGDTMLDVDLDRFCTWHRRIPNTAGTLLLHPNDHPDDSDLVEIDEDGFITAFYPRPRDSQRYHRNLVSAALYWMRRTALAPFRETHLRDFGSDLFPAMIARGIPLYGYISPEYIKDCGTPARLDAICRDVADGKPAAMRLDTRQIAIFLDRDGTINRHVVHLQDPAQLELLPNAADAIRKINESRYRCCVVTNQPVVARGECTVEQLREIHNKLDSLLGQAGAYIESLYYCPHHPDKGFTGEIAELKVACDCRKPNTKLIDQACIELNIERSGSWMVGDSTSDIELARRTKLKSILVETGQAGLDYCHWARPDYVVPDLRAAVDFILEGYPRLCTLARDVISKLAGARFVLIGGQSRSGKSTFASILRDVLAEAGKKAVIICVDSWLRPEPQRKPGVLGRYDLASLQRIINHIAASKVPRTLEIAGYHKLERRPAGVAERLVISPDDVVIVDGTISLLLENPPGCAAYRVFVEIDESERRARVLRECRLRSLDEADAELVYNARRMDEIPVINASAKGARRVRVYISRVNDY